MHGFPDTMALHKWVAPKHLRVVAIFLVCHCENAANKVDHWGFLPYDVFNLNATRVLGRGAMSVGVELHTQRLRDGLTVLHSWLSVGAFGIAFGAVGDYNPVTRRRRRWGRWWQGGWSTRWTHNCPIVAHRAVVSLPCSDVALRCKVADGWVFTFVRHWCVGLARGDLFWCTVGAIRARVAEEESRAWPSVVTLPVVRHEEARVVAAVRGLVSERVSKPVVARTWRNGASGLETPSGTRKRVHWRSDAGAHLAVNARPHLKAGATPTVVVVCVAR